MMLLMWSNFQLLIYVVIKQTWEEKAAIGDLTALLLFWFFSQSSFG